MFVLGKHHVTSAQTTLHIGTQSQEGRREPFPGRPASWLSYARKLAWRVFKLQAQIVCSSLLQTSPEWVQGAVSRRRLWRMQAGEGPMRHRAQAPALAPVPARQCRIVEEGPHRSLTYSVLKRSLEYECEHRLPPILSNRLTA